jgi:DNA mismatch repair ATPase MutS
MCLPSPHVAGGRTHIFSGLYDVSLALRYEGRVVGNSVDAHGKDLVVVTGANQGGKSTFLRSIGLAQLMMQCGMFVGAESFASEICPGVFTHYKRQEDTTMESGKFDEEMVRISTIADRLTPNALVLLNESFAATNEREGSEIARQIVDALIERHIKVFFVTHLYEFARIMFIRNAPGAMFLQAERKPDGTRTFEIKPGAPKQTSYGQDLYRQVFDQSMRKDATVTRDHVGADEIERCLEKPSLS